MTNETRLSEAAAEALLPWYVNGTLEVKERRQVEEALEESQTLRTELHRLERLGSLVASDALAAPEPRADGFARLQRMIAAPANKPQRLAWSERLAQFFELSMRPAVVAALMLVVAIETVAVVAVLSRTETPRFVTASGPAEGAKAVVQFKPETTLSDIQAILGAEQATIVRGPTPDGSLVVQWPGLGTEAVDRAIERLRSNPEFVLRAERGT